MQNILINPKDYTIRMERTIDLSESTIISSSLETRSEITRAVLAEIEEKIGKYGVCVLDFEPDCISQLGNWANFYEKNIAYSISQDNRTITIRKTQV